MAVLGQSQPLMYGQQIMQMPDGSFTQTVAYGTVAAADGGPAAAAGEGAASVATSTLQMPTTTSTMEETTTTATTHQHQQHLSTTAPSSAAVTNDMNHASTTLEDQSIDDRESGLSDAGLTSPNKNGGGGASSQITMNNRYRCSECARGLSTGFSLKRHMHTVHGMPKVSCTWRKA